jgi:hypothetical protein
MKTSVFLVLFHLFCNFESDAQKKIRSFKLDDELKEISGLESINDSLFIGHNDGGNDPLLYVMNQEGKILKSCKIYNAKNTDWEDLTKDDKGNLYIADIGNNANKRKKVRILKVELDSVLLLDSVNASVY